MSPIAKISVQAASYPSMTSIPRSDRHMSQACNNLHRAPGYQNFHKKSLLVFTHGISWDDRKRSSGYTCMEREFCIDVRVTALFSAVINYVPKYKMYGGAPANYFVAESPDVSSNGA
jgi:hypothetical protein